MPTRETSVLFFLAAISVICGCSAWKCPIDTPPTLIPNGEYRPRGKVVSAVDMKVYEVGPDNSSHILIGIHDIFGIGPNTNTMEVSDIFADGGSKVILPDFFHGESWSEERFGPPITSNPAFVVFLEKYSWENSVRNDLRKLIEHYKGLGFAKFGIFGYKFGGLQVLSASEEFSDTFLVAGQFSPSPAFTVEAHRVKVPTAIFHDFPDWDKNLDVVEYCKIISSDLGDGSCVGKDYGNLKLEALGGAEADWAKAEIRARASNSLLIFQQFLCTKFLS